MVYFTPPPPSVSAVFPIDSYGPTLMSFLCKIFFIFQVENNLFLS